MGQIGSGPEPCGGNGSGPGLFRARWAAFVDRPLSGSVRWSGYALALLFFVGILVVRGGPNPAENDAHAITLPTTAISHGDLRTAEQETYQVPNPPGYPLLTAGLVAALRPWVGSPRWCDDKAVPSILLQSPGRSYYLSLLSPCRAQPATGGLPHWFRSQAVLAVLGWVVLAAGAVALLRAAGAGAGVGELVVIAGLAGLPATSDTIVQSFHPQDLMSVGFACAALAGVLRGRYGAAGLLFGVAFLCKQFALLPLLAALAFAPRWRERAWLAVVASGVFVTGVLPFFLVDPADTGHALTAVFVQGAGIIKSPTMLGQLAIAEQHKLEIARDAPIACAVVLTIWMARRWRGRTVAPTTLVGVALACLALRLVFEISILDYYFLAVGSFLLVLDCCSRRPPVLSVGWIVATRYGLTALALAHPTWVTAVAFLAASMAAGTVGMAAARPWLLAPTERALMSEPSPVRP